MEHNEKISIVIPCYNSENTLKDVVYETIAHLEENLKDFDYEFILINDCSRDGTANVIAELCEENDAITGIDFAKNFGQHAALLAGFREQNGDYVLCMDDDGQMPVESICDMISVIRGDTDVVLGKYQETKQPFHRRLGSQINKYMTEILLDKPKNIDLNSFWCAKRYVIDEIIRYDGPYPYLGGLLLRTTSKIENIEVRHRNRADGQSGYSFFKLIKLWLNGFTAFSEKPLRIVSIFGILSAFMGFIFMLIVLIKKLNNPNIEIGYSSTICVILFIGGVLMMSLGIVGEYIGRIYICINNSPQYVVRKKIKK